MESNRRQIRQPPSVPFLWEEQPGIPKKEWKLGFPSASVTTISSPRPPFKAIDFVPFAWEEVPETRLISFSPPLQYYINLMDSHLPLPPALTGGHGGEPYYYECEISSSSGDDCDDPVGNHDEHEEGGQEKTCSKSDMKSFVFEINRVPSHPIKLVASVPFMWEEKPGTPLPSFSWHMSETDSPPPPPEPNLLMLPPPPPLYSVRHENNHAFGPSSVTRILSRPIKLVASVPFSWEEMPGKPLPSFSWQFLETDQTQLEVSISYGNNMNSHYDDDDMFEFDVESFSFDNTDESFSSVANRPVPSAAISTTVPVQTNPFLSMDQDEEYPDTDTESSTSSNGTEASSFVGSSLLDWLFPHFPPKSGLLEKNGASEKVPPELEKGRRDLFGSSSNGSFAFRRPKTLGELIMMSRRRSYVRKAAQITKQNPSIHGFVKRGTFGGWNLGNTGRKLIEGLNLKRQLRLKLV